MRILAGLGAVALLGVIIWDAFEAIVLPRRVTRRFRPTRWFYRGAWTVWSALGARVAGARRRETVLGVFGPLSLLVLLTAWAASLIVGFGVLQWAIGSRLVVAGGSPTFADDLYMSGTTFFTLGLGDVTPTGALPRILAVVESGLGFGFLAIVIGYLPVLYQAFSRREVSIALLDARAGSPPTAAELLRRHGGDLEALAELLREWERWSAELLESHLSYPVLSYFRSQHDNQSWLAALTAVLDGSALAIVGIRGACARQAELTFAMARHAVADLAQVLGVAPRAPQPDRLPDAALARLADHLAAHAVILERGEAAAKRLAELRGLYEPYVAAMAAHLRTPLPPWWVESAGRDNWETTAWGTARRGTVGVVDAE